MSTPTLEVITLYGAVVRIAEGPEPFVAAVEGAPERERRRREEDALLRRSSWDRIAGDMQALIADRLARKPAARYARCVAFAQTIARAVTRSRFFSRSVPGARPG